MAANTSNQYQAMVSEISTADSIENLAHILNNSNNIIPIDCKVAYEFLNTGKHNEASKALATIGTKLASLFEASGKSAGISTIYNVIDARVVRKVRFTHKLAYNLQGSKMLAQFLAMAACVNRNETTRQVTSVNGTIFAQNRNAYTTQAVNKQGKQVTIRKAQASNEISAIRQGRASAITSAPKTSAMRKIAKVVSNLLTVNNQLALPMSEAK